LREFGGIPRARFEFARELAEPRFEERVAQRVDELQRDRSA
jgi:hypothetical protein